MLSLNALASDARTEGSSRAQETGGDLVSRLSDLSAHIVTREVRKDRPVLRVLFHSSHRVFLNTNKKNNIIILVSAVLNNKTVEGECLACLDMFVLLLAGVSLCRVR